MKFALPRLLLLALCLSASAPLLLPQSPAVDRARRAQRARQAQDEFYRMRAWPNAGIPSGARAAALAEMDRMVERERRRAPRASAADWRLIGPQPTNTAPEQSSVGGSPFSAGRVAALAVDPRNADVAYMGAAGGGVWKTTDGGLHWTPLTDDQPSLATGAIALAPSNPDIVYVGTGEQNNSGDSYYGAGILKSTNGGATWTQITGPFVGPFGPSRVSGGGARIGAIAVHPSNPDIVLAAIDRTTGAGIYRTADGGATWTLTLPGAVASDVLFHPSDPNTVYGALGATSGTSLNGVYKSTDGGATWARSGGGGATALPTAGVGRIALAIAPSNPSILFAGIQNAATGGLLGLYKSTDGGASWTRQASPDYCAPQCSYNNVVRVSPVNSSLVIAAGLPPYRSLDGGATWSNISSGADGLIAHTDHHALAFAADGSRLYVGNDGGVFSTATLGPGAVTWKNLNTTLAITEFSSNMAIDPTDANRMVAGTQDNGTLLYSGRLEWEEAVGGDGGSTAMDPALPGIWYGAFQGPQIYKISDVMSFNTLRNPFFGASPVLNNGMLLTDRFLSYPPLALDPSNPERLYFPSQRLYQSDDGAGTWKAISNDLTGGNGAITAIAVSPANPQAVAIGTNSGRLHITDATRQGASTPWADRSSGLPTRGISQIVFHPTEPQTLYVALTGFSGFAATPDAGHIFKTTDYGMTWSNVSSDLPNIPVNDLVVDPDQPDVVYAATDIGVFQSPDGGATWSTLSNGLPRVLVRSIQLHRPARVLRAATYGRSMWDLPVPLTAASKRPRVDAVSPAAVAAAATLTVTGANFTKNSLVRWNGVDRAPSLVSPATLRFTLTEAEAARAGRGTLLVFDPTPGAGLSNAWNVPVGPPPALTAASFRSAASSAEAPVVPGSIASIVGANLAPVTVSAASPPLPYTLGGVTVEFNGLPSPLYFVSPTQINFQVPWELEGYSRAILTVSNGAQMSAPITVAVAEASPSIFAVNGSGSGQGTVLIAGTGLLAAPAGAFPGSRPARRGEFIEIYATGLGPVSRIQTDGQPKVSTTVALSRPPTVLIGGAPATVTFSGLTPGGVGLYQINAQIPVSAPVGDTVPITISLRTATSNAVTIAVQ